MCQHILYLLFLVCLYSKQALLRKSLQINITFALRRILNVTIIMSPVRTNLMIRDSLGSFINTLPHCCVCARNIMTRVACVTFGLSGGYCDLIVINYIDKHLTLTLIF